MKVHLNPAGTPIAQVHDWPSYFAQVRHRPGMWFGRASLECLRAQIIGIHMAEDLYVVSESARLGGFSFPEFEAWVALNFNPDKLSLGSYSLARCAAPSDEAAFELWFTWYDAFVSGSPAPLLPNYPGTLPFHP